MNLTQMKVLTFPATIVGKTLMGGTVILALMACSKSERMEIEIQREITANFGDGEVGATSADRFGPRHSPDDGHDHSGDGGGGGDQFSAPENPLAWEIPKGWDSLPPTAMRVANLRPAGNPDAECTLTLLAGDGGGELDNVNRWRNQMGLGPIDQVAMDAIPTMPILGMDAPFFQLDGAYSGMGNEAKPDWSLLGMILSTEQFTIFIKMNGPKDLVEAERDNFFAFCTSLHIKERGTPPPNKQDEEPTTGGRGFVMPEGWRMGPQRSMRTLNLLAGESSECYLVLLGGEGGGLAPNINRWCGEVGMEAMSDEEIAQLPTVKLYGVDSPMLEVSGDYKGMGGNDSKGSTLLGVALVRPEGSAFVKMVGPAAEIAKEKQKFMALVESLEE
ncbi:MAG: hypothetical protein QF489_07945 [Planctomycetota bacterium]|nr:hypothetical protein [Planctomycetota bacterium]